jgi:hypothetical protein
MTDHVHDTHQSVPATGPLALKSNLGLGPNAQDVARESVDDALLIVESYGAWGPDLNDVHRRQIVLANEVLTLRSQLAHWKTFAIHAEGEHAAWKKTAIELDEELRALKAAASDGRTYTQADLLEAAKTDRERCMRKIEALYWMPRVQGRWDETDVAHAEGFSKAKAEALAALGA